MSCTTCIKKSLEPSTLSMIEDHSLIQNFTPQVRKDLLNASTHVLLKKGDGLFMHQDSAHSFYFIEKGWIKIFRESLDGTEVVLDVLSAGDIFGISSIFDENHNYPFSAEAVEKTQLTALPLSIMENEVKKNNKLALSFMKHLVQKANKSSKEIEHRIIQNAPQRLGCLLLRLVPLGSESPLEIQLPYSKTLLANRLGIKPETFSRALAKLQEDIDLKITGATVQIRSVKELAAYSCPTCSGTYPCPDLKPNKRAI